MILPIIEGVKLCVHILTIGFSRTRSHNYVSFCFTEAVEVRGAFSLEAVPFSSGLGRRGSRELSDLVSGLENEVNFNIMVYIRTL